MIYRLKIVPNEMPNDEGEWITIDHPNPVPTGSWAVAGYCMQHDHFVNCTCKPTHFMKIGGPVDA